ncbi:MAG TPA: hypothetical protein VE933_05835 [Chitinophagaceae bacterium]|nr:hypothetical protein [Chitinophagaceae bacterium]
MKLEVFPVYVLVVTGLFSNCAKSSSNEDTEPCTIQADSIAIASKQLTLSDAEKIMGDPASLTCNTFIQRASTLEYKCTYTALSEDDRTGETGKLYFMSEVYDAEDAAKAAYAEIYQANRKHEGVEIVPGLGDEAYYHSDGTNFYFFLVRKDKKMFRLKLNKVTSHSSVTDFKEVARLITDRM